MRNDSSATHDDESVGDREEGLDRKRRPVAEQELVPALHAPGDLNRVVDHVLGAEALASRLFGAGRGTEGVATGVGVELATVFLDVLQVALAQLGFVESGGELVDCPHSLLANLRPCASSRATTTLDTVDRVRRHDPQENAALEKGARTRTRKETKSGIGAQCFAKRSHEDERTGRY